MNVFLPSAPGTYALQLRLSSPLERNIGKLGRFYFPAGEFIYIGSAFSPGGLHARLGRHLHHTGKPHWHIDYLLPLAQPVGYWITTLSIHMECRWVTGLMTLPGISIPARGLGASDCTNGCMAHLLAFTGIDQQIIGERLEQITSRVAYQEHTRDYQVIRAILYAQ